MPKHRMNKPPGPAGTPAPSPVSTAPAPKAPAGTPEHKEKRGERAKKAINKDLKSTEKKVEQLSIWGRIKTFWNKDLRSAMKDFPWRKVGITAAIAGATLFGVSWFGFPPMGVAPFGIGRYIRKLLFPNEMAFNAFRAIRDKYAGRTPSTWQETLGPGNHWYDSWEELKGSEYREASNEFMPESGMPQPGFLERLFGGIAGEQGGETFEHAVGPSAKNKWIHKVESEVGERKG